MNFAWQRDLLSANFFLIHLVSRQTQSSQNFGMSQIEVLCLDFSLALTDISSCHSDILATLLLDKGGGMSKALVRSLSLVVLLFGSLSLIWAQEPDAKQTSQAPDNTKINQRDRNKAEPTADQQKENRSDREIARQIRRAIVKDKSLSTYAHNIKIIAQDGMVTLKGPVNTQEEKQAIEAKATAIAGQGKITNEIEVGSRQASKPSPSHYR